MKLTKKLIAVVLSVIMIFSMIAVPVSATETITESSKVEEVVDEDTSIEEAADQIGEVFSAIRNLIDAIHNLVGGIMGILGKECPFCDEVHDKDAEEEPDEEDLEKYYEKLLGIKNDANLDDNNDNNIPDALEDILDVDTDKDCIPDWMEKIYKTDPNDVDTDNDGLNDGYELMVLGTDPLKVDTDDNGINDGNEDFDKDLLNNTLENQLKTHPHKKDTDEDSISDYDEYTSLKTDPTKKDTDEDGLNDGDELIYLMSPNNPDTLNDGILDGDREFSVKKSGPTSDNDSVDVSIDIDLKGNQIESFIIEKVDSDDIFLNMDIPGYIGNAYDFTVDGEFDSATVSFNLAQSLFEDPNFDPAIYYWDEVNEVLIELENQIVSGTTISATLEHFSNYIVLDKSKYETGVLEYEIEAPTDQELQNKKFDIILTLDESGSISSSNYRIMKERCVELLGYLAEEDRIGVITFDDSVRTVLGLSDKASAETTLKNLTQHNGNTALYSAINKAYSLLENEEGSTKIVVALTDGKDNSSSISSSNVVSKLQSKNIVLYTIGVGSSVSSSLLKQMAEGTGGQYYPVSSFSNLSVVFERIISDADLYKDSDEDGISDYHEKCIANGKLKTGTGAVIMNANSLSYLNEDSDGDGLLDGEEIEIKNRTVNGKTVYYCYIYSNPCIADTDGDGLNDYEEIYIGFKPLRVENSTDLPLNASMSVNNKSDWDMLKKEHAVNAVHIAVQTDILKKYPGMLMEVPLTPSKRRIDLLWPATYAIWDVKPASYQFSPNREKGLKQLNDYCILAKQMDNVAMHSVHIGGSMIKGDTIPTALGNYKVEYKNMQNGLITYHFERTIPIAPPIEEPETVETPANEKDLYEYLWDVAKSVGYSAATFGEAVLEAIADLGATVYNYADEIIATGIAIGGILGIAYIIAHLLPVLVFA